MTVLRIAAIVGVVFSALAAPVQAGTKDDIRDLQARMARVEQALLASSAATVRITELESQIQELTGRIEELNYRLEQQDQRLEAITAALSGDLAYGSGDGYGSGPSYLGSGDFAGPVALGPEDPIGDEIARSDDDGGFAAPSPTAPANVELPLNPDAAFDYASSFLLSGDYARSKAAFQLFGEAFPNHARAADAKFRLGEIHLALGENADAAKAFLEHVQKYPNDPRSAEAHLKLGTAFARMDRAEQACKIFKTMKSKFPNAPAPVSQRADSEMARIGCR